MKRPIVLGLVFIVAGIACIFPFIRALVLENIVVMLGAYFIYRGYLYLTAPIQSPKEIKKQEETLQSGKNDSCQPDCKK